MNAAPRAPQMKRDGLDWPFFGESHRAFAGALDRFVMLVNNLSNRPLALKNGVYSILS